MVFLSCQPSRDGRKHFGHNQSKPLVGMDSCILEPLEVVLYFQARQLLLPLDCPSLIASTNCYARVTFTMERKGKYTIFEGFFICFGILRFIFMHSKSLQFSYSQKAYRSSNLVNLFTCITYLRSQSFQLIVFNTSLLSTSPSPRD